MSVPPSASELITEPTSEQANMQIAFAALLAARRETFLARYPRWLKLGVVGVVLILLLSPLFMGGEAKPQAQEPALPDLIAAHEDDVRAEEEKKSKAIAARPVPEKVELKSDFEKAAAAFNDSNEPTQRMPAAPDMAVTEETPSGRLPTISPDGRKPWQVYGRPFDHQDPRPRVAIVVTDLGFSRVATDAALRRTPAAVTLAFDVQGTAVDSWLQRARQDGHETLLSLPMEPFDYPRSDPGPNSLLTTLPNADNIQRLLGFLRMGAGYVGVTTMSGSRFASDTNKLEPIMAVLRDRGLLVLDTRVTNHSAVGALAKQMNVPAALSSRVIDANLTPASIDAALAELEQTARVEGAVVGLASPLPLTLERIEAWSKQLAERGIVLAPLSAIAK